MKGEHACGKNCVHHGDEHDISLVFERSYFAPLCLS